MSQTVGKNPEKEHGHMAFGWGDIESSIKIIHQKLGDIEPTIIVGIARGGLVPAQLLSYKYNCRVESLTWQLRDHDYLRDDNRLFEIIMNNPTGDHTIIFADDILDSGQTLWTLRNRVVEIFEEEDFIHGYEPNVYYVAMLKKAYADNSLYVNYGVRTDFKGWIDFPWGE